MNVLTREYAEADSRFIVKTQVRDFSILPD